LDSVQEEQDLVLIVAQRGHYCILCIVSLTVSFRLIDAAIIQEVEVGILWLTALRGVDH